MMSRQPGRWTAPLGVAASLAIAGCVALEGATALPRGERVVDGEVRSVDVRGQRIDVRSGRGSLSLHYDRGTRVFYQQRDYPPSALEPGDRVRAWVTQERGGQLWAERIDVVQSRQTAGRVERLEGTFGRGDPTRRTFTVLRGRSAPVAVYVPPDARREDIRRLERLRPGERVRLDVRVIARNNLELVRFR